MSKELWPHQAASVNAIHYYLAKGIKRMALVLPTGTGKSFTAAQAIKDMGRILWIVHTEELGEQGAEVLRQTFGLSTSGLIKADVFDVDHQIVIATAQTLHNRLNRLSPDYFDVIVADECDLFGAVTFQKSLDYFTPKLRLGLTATFFRMDNMSLTDIFDVVAYEYTIEQAIGDGYLAKPEAIIAKTNINLDTVHTVAGEFNQKELTEKVNTPERNNFIVDQYIKYGKGMQFIAFCCDVQHTIDLCEAFKERGVNCEYVVGDKELTTDRTGCIQRFKSNQTTGLTNCMILSVGFDYPDTGMTIMACPTKSKRKFIQQIGRSLRLKSEWFVDQWGQKAIILDIVDCTTKHKLINTKELDRELRLEKKIFISEKDRQLLLDTKAKREATFTAQQRLKDEFVDLFALPIVKINKSIRLQESATENQLAWLKKLGYDIVNDHFTKQHFNEIIALQSATDNEIQNLKKCGYDTSNGVTVAEYKRAMEEIREREAKANSIRLKKENRYPFNDMR